MAIRHNNIIANNHFHKQWQRRVKTWFNQPARKFRRHQKRVQKARDVAPRPIKKLRPVTRCPTFKYNTKERLGRGFTADELKAAGISKRDAVACGISVDKRRRNKSTEALQQNVQRLKEYKSKLILFPINPAKPKKGDSTPEEMKMATQYSGVVMPHKATFKPEKARSISDIERKHSVFQSMRVARSHAKLWGIRAKRKKEAEEKALNAKPKKK